MSVRQERKQTFTEFITSNDKCQARFNITRYGKSKRYNVQSEKVKLGKQFTIAEGETTWQAVARYRIKVEKRHKGETLICYGVQIVDTNNPSRIRLIHAPSRAQKMLMQFFGFKTRTAIVDLYQEDLVLDSLERDREEDNSSKWCDFNEENRCDVYDEMCSMAGICLIEEDKVGYYQEQYDEDEMAEADDSLLDMSDDALCKLGVINEPGKFVAHTIYNTDLFRFEIHEHNDVWGTPSNTSSYVNNDADVICTIKAGHPEPTSKPSKPSVIEAM